MARAINEVAFKYGERRCMKCTYQRPLGEFWRVHGKYLTRCRICTKQYQDKRRETYRDTNTTKKRARAKRWRERHPELFKQRIKAWQAKNRDAMAEVQRRRRSCLKYRVTKKDYKFLYRYQSGCCYICNTWFHKLHVDHVYPIKRGGYHGIGNLLLACRDCNRSKGTKLLVEVRYHERRGKLGFYST